MYDRGVIEVTPRPWVKHGHRVHWAVNGLSLVLWQPVEQAEPEILARGQALGFSRVNITEEVHPEAGKMLQWAWRTIWI